MDVPVTDIPLERPASGPYSDDPTIPDRGAFAEFMAYAHPNDRGGIDYNRDQMQEAYAAGWEAAISGHECLLIWCNLHRHGPGP